MKAGSGKIIFTQEFLEFEVNFHLQQKCRSRLAKLFNSTNSKVFIEISYFVKMGHLHQIDEKLKQAFVNKTLFLNGILFSKTNQLSIAFSSMKIDFLHFPYTFSL